MLGRAAYHDPYLLSEVDRRMFGSEAAPPTRRQVVAAMSDYLGRECAEGTVPRQIVRHMHGLYQGQPGARRWRRLLSEAQQLEAAGAGILELASRQVEDPLRLHADEAAPA